MPSAETLGPGPRYDQNLHRSIQTAASRSSVHIEAYARDKDHRMPI